MSFRRVIALSLLIAAGVAQAQAPASEAPTASSPAAAEAAALTASGAIVGDTKAGEGKATACGACHGMDGNSADKQYPKLAGQNEAYIARQIKLFQSQKRQNAIMMGFAAALSEQDMHDIGAFFATKRSLPGVADDKLLERGQALYRGGDTTLGVPACMACHGPDGRGITRTADSGNQAGAISEVAIADNVTAVRNGSGNLELIAWNISADGKTITIEQKTTGEHGKPARYVQVWDTQ